MSKLTVEDIKIAKKVLEAASLGIYSQTLVIYRNAIWELKGVEWVIRERLPKVKVTARRRKKWYIRTSKKNSL